MLAFTMILGPERGGGKDAIPELNGGSILGGRGDMSLLRRYGGCNPFRGGGVKVALADGGNNLEGDPGIGGMGALFLIATFLVFSRGCCNPGGGGGKPVI